MFFILSLLLLLLSLFLSLLLFFLASSFPMGRGGGGRVGDKGLLGSGSEALGSVGSVILYYALVLSKKITKKNKLSPALSSA